MARKKKYAEDSLCWECKNAVPNFDKLQGCSWSIFFVPVKGWDAIPTIVNNGYDKYHVLMPPTRSYHVNSCPYFEKG